MKAATAMLECALLLVTTWFNPGSFEVPKETGTIVTRVNRMIVIAAEANSPTRKHELPAGVKIFLDGVPAKVDDLQPGDRVVLTFDDDKRITNVEATSGKRQAIVATFLEPLLLNH